jgi:hypothetical protein
LRRLGIAAATLVVSMLVTSPAFSQPARAPESAAGKHAFETTLETPGWTATRGGADGRMIVVDTLAADGPGSLAAALAADDPRVITFAVGGIIDLAGKRLSVRSPHVTIAGETAPNPGITLIRGGMNIGTHDVIVRHIRIRPGEAGHAKKSGWDIDGLATGLGAHDIIVDHCSFSWSTDENLSASGPRFEGATPDEWRRNTSHRVTFSHCIIGEALHHSTHSKGTPHSMGSLIHDNTSDIAIVGNLYISNNARNPLFKGGARGIVSNNLIHNPGGDAVTYGLVPEEWEDRPWQRGQLAIVGNVIRHGPSTKRNAAPIRFGSNWGVPECDAYIHDNLAFDQTGRPLAIQVAVHSRPKLERAGEFRLLQNPPTWPKAFQARPAAEVTDWVLASAGARPWDRDAVDRRLIQEAHAGSGRIINGEDEVGGYAVQHASIAPYPPSP